MRKSLRTDEHRRLVALLREIRERRKLTQQEVAKRLERPQSFVAKYEGGERRLDVAEFVQIARALESDPARLFRLFLSGMTSAGG